MDKLKTNNFLGIDIIDEKYELFIENLNKSIINSGPINIMSVNLTALKRYNKEFEYFVKSFNYTTADGKGLVIFSRFLGDRIKNHLSIPRLCDKLIKKYFEQKKKIYLLGATPDINKLALSKLKNIYPNINIKGHHGYFDLDNIGLSLNTLN